MKKLLLVMKANQKAKLTFQKTYFNKRESVYLFHQK